MTFWLSWDAATTGTDEIPPGTTLRVSETVTFVPADGWLLESDTRTAESVSVVRQSNRFTVAQSTWQGTRDELVERQKELVKANDLRLTSGQQTFHNPHGLSGVRFSFFGTSASGVVWVATDEARETALVMRAVGPRTLAPGSMIQFQQMVDSVRTETGQ
ncbi:hypothetical protein ACGFYZ_34055 [Streptomyces sp. NPDC048330]|uniref:hypothetical protein n=1 Tax=Streptomyces sp. NPDC048330 TaxID=3365533 RepID=UPI003716570B